MVGAQAEGVDATVATGRQRDILPLPCSADAVACATDRSWQAAGSVGQKRNRRWRAKQDAWLVEGIRALNLLGGESRTLMLPTRHLQLSSQPYGGLVSLMAASTALPKMQNR